MKGLRFGIRTAGGLACAATWLLGLIGGGGTVAAQAERPSTNAVVSLSVAPNDAARVVAGTLNSPDPGGIYYSEDGGVTWTPAEGTPLNVSISALEHDAVNPAVVYAGDAAAGGLFLRSTDGGRTFTAVDSLQGWLTADGNGIGALYSHALNGFSVLHAGTRLDGVLTSRDNGESWAINAIGLPRTDDIAQSARRVRALLMHEGDFYIGTHDGVYMQPAGSDRWQRAEGMPEGALVRALGAYRNGLYAGLASQGLWRRAADGTWAPVPGFASAASVFSLDPVGSLFVAGTGLGPWAGNGDRWRKSAVDGQARDVWVHTADSQGKILYLGTRAEWVLRSDDEGYSFRSFGSFAPLEPRPLPPIAPPPASNDEVPAPTAAAPNDPTPEPTAPPASNDEAPAPTAAAPNDPTPEPARNAFATTFYNNANLEGPAVLRRVDPMPLAFIWDRDAPDPVVNANEFSARFDGLFDFETARYRFNVYVDDGIRLYIDDRLILDEWRAPQTEGFAPEVDLLAGTHHVRIEYFEMAGRALLELSWQNITSLPTSPPPTPPLNLISALSSNTIDLPFGITIGSVALPWIGTVSPVLFAGGCLLVLLILLSVISVFRNSGDEE